MSIRGFIATLLLLQRTTTNALPTLQIYSREGAADTGANASALLDKTIEAVGGTESLNLVTGIKYESSSIYRSQTLTQNYNLHNSDQSVAEAGSQNLSFSFTDAVLRERIDRTYQYNDYWIWASPDLQPAISYSLVVQDGLNSSACFINGQNSFFAEDPTQPAGYADAYLTDYLVHQARQYALPYLLKQFIRASSELTVSTSTDATSGLIYRSLHHQKLGLEILVDDTTSLPYAIRSQENHTIFGLTTSDLRLINYTTVVIDAEHSLQLPHRMQTIYSSDTVLEDFIIDSIIINPSFAPEYFTALPPQSFEDPDSSVTALAPAAPLQSEQYPRSEVHEMFEAGLWGGPFGEMFNVSDVVLQPVFLNGTTPQIMNLYVGYPDYVQLLIEFEDGLLITDAPAHRSTIILDYVKEMFSGKQVKWVVPSHHHRDHAGGVGDYLAAGATLVVPEIAASFYAGVNNGDFNIVTYTQDSPFVLEDKNTQFRSYWHEENPHARDWTYAVAGKACPADDDKEFVVFNADVVSPGPGEALRWDTGFARQWLLQAMRDSVPTEATIIGAHGSSELGLGTQDTLASIAGLAGVQYPEIKPGAARCQ